MRCGFCSISTLDQMYRATHLEAHRESTLRILATDHVGALVESMKGSEQARFMGAKDRIGDAIERWRTRAGVVEAIDRALGCSPYVTATRVAAQFAADRKDMLNKARAELAP